MEKTNSRRNFEALLSNEQKELRYLLETNRYWLKLAKERLEQQLNNPIDSSLIEETKQLIKIYQNSIRVIKSKLEVPPMVFIRSENMKWCPKCYCSVKPLSTRYCKGCGAKIAWRMEVKRVGSEY